MRDRERNIVHETANLYLYRTASGLELRLDGIAHSVVIGRPADESSALRTMERLERYPGNMRRMYAHFS